MATKLLYLDGFDVVTCDAIVQTVTKSVDGRDVVMLDQTCFYPRGGGQDWDMGFISAKGEVEYIVQEVRLDESGVVQHVGEFNPGTFMAGDVVECRVDVNRRDINSRLHSAGHLIDMAVFEIAPNWIPGKGAHYPHMSFVEYTVPEAAPADDAVIQHVQSKLDELLQGEYQHKIMFLNNDEISNYCRHVPDNIPANKPSRIVLYANNFGIPCGGTHVRQAKDIGELTITKIKIKKNIAKVSYAVTGIS